MNSLKKNSLKCGNSLIIINARVAAGILLCLFPLFVAAQIDCSTLQPWIQLDDNVKLNQKHVFCGEWDRNRPKGFHARPGGVNPDAVAIFVIQDKANAAGIYTGRWSYKDHPGRNKFSSMFPDGCSVAQVLNSITYAIENLQQCPMGSPKWTQCGPNRPKHNINANDTAENGSKYCSINNMLFTIAFAPHKNGKVNTAFPLYE